MGPHSILADLEQPGLLVCSFEFDLEALGLLPGTDLSGLGDSTQNSPTRAQNGISGGGAISDEVTALREQVSSLKVGLDCWVPGPSENPLCAVSWWRR